MNHMVCHLSGIKKSFTVWSNSSLENSNYLFEAQKYRPLFMGVIRRDFTVYHLHTFTNPIDEEHNVTGVYFLETTHVMGRINQPLWKWGKSHLWNILLRLTCIFPIFRTYLGYISYQQPMLPSFFLCKCIIFLFFSPLRMVIVKKVNLVFFFYKNGSSNENQIENE